MGSFLYSSIKICYGDIENCDTRTMDLKEKESFFSFANRWFTRKQNKQDLEFYSRVKKLKEDDSFSHRHSISIPVKSSVKITKNAETNSKDLNDNYDDIIRKSEDRPSHIDSSYRYSTTTNPPKDISLIGRYTLNEKSYNANEILSENEEERGSLLVVYNPKKSAKDRIKKELREKIEYDDKPYQKKLFNRDLNKGMLQKINKSLNTSEKKSRMSIKPQKQNKLEDSMLSLNTNYFNHQA